MATANKLLEAARAELGVKESPAGSNRVKYGAWYGMNGQPWCMMFIQWVFAQAHVALPVKTASCGAFMRAAQTAGNWITSGYLPGDVVIFDFPGGAKTDHCGIVDEVSAGYLWTIEGNTGSGNDANGGEVQRRKRALSLVVGAYRPTYEKEAVKVNLDNTPKISAEAVKWAQDAKILNGNKSGDLMLSSPCTREQMMVFLHRYHKKFGK